MSIFGFDTTDENAATAALIVYAIYRSRDRARYKVTPDMWSQIERFTKAAAKRARTIPALIEALKPRLMCGTIHPRWMQVGMAGETPLTLIKNEDGSLAYAVSFGSDDIGRREFLTRIIERADQRAAIRRAYEETAWIILLVRNRLESERAIETHLDVIERDAAEHEALLPPEAIIDGIKQLED